MKYNPLKFFELLAFCIFLAGALAAAGQTRPTLGGYKSVPLTDAAVEEAANFAVETKAAELDREILLEAIHKAETQTAQGTNYRLCLEVLFQGEETDDGDIFFIKTVIHKNLQKEFKITSWEEVDDCSGK